MFRCETSSAPSSDRVLFSHCSICRPPATSPSTLQSIDEMLLRTIALVAWTLPLVSAASKLTWTPCSYLTHPELTPKNTNSADCTVYSAPLCHPGVCEAPDSANATVDVYVRRVKALVGDPNKASNVWLLQGADYSASTRKYGPETRFVLSP